LLAQQIHQSRLKHRRLPQDLVEVPVVVALEGEVPVVVVPVVVVPVVEVLEEVVPVVEVPVVEVPVVVVPVVVVPVVVLEGVQAELAEVEAVVAVVAQGAQGVVAQGAQGVVATPAESMLVQVVAVVAQGVRIQMRELQIFAPKGKTLSKKCIGQYGRPGYLYTYDNALIY
jgi:hypothetical protein